MDYNKDFNLILNSLDDAIIIVDSENKILYQNSYSEKIFSNNFSGLPISNLVRDPIILESYQNVIRTKENHAVIFVASNFIDNWFSFGKKNKKQVITLTCNKKVTLFKYFKCMKPKILLVEDESSIIELIKYNLLKSDFLVDVAEDGEQAVDLIFSDKKYDLIIIDWMLPEISGIELCRRIRKNKDTKNIPLIMLTARGEEEDRLRGFEAEVDDYITKPFSIKELVARIRAVLKRLRPVFFEEVLTYKEIQMDISTHTVIREGILIKLGPTEFNLLRFLLENQGKVYSRDQLLNHVWDNGSYVEPRTVDVHVRRLRKALNTGFKVDPIRTIRSAGYSLGN